MRGVTTQVSAPKSSTACIMALKISRTPEASAVRLCVPFRAYHVTSISHRGHHGWGRFPSSRITTVSMTCRCQKFAIITVCVNACPLHTSTGKGLGPSLVRNAILYVLGLSPPLYHPSPSNPNLILATQCWVWWCITSDPKNSTYENYLMAALSLTENRLSKAYMEYHVKFGYTLGRIQHIALMSRINIFYSTCHLVAQKLVPNIPGLWGIK